MPYPHSWGVASPGYAAGTIDAAGEKYAFVIQVPKTGTLDKFEFRVGAVTFDAASVLRASLQTPSPTTGEPDETQDEYRDITSLTANFWIVPGLMTSDGTDGGAKRSVTEGDLLACVVEFQTFTTGDTVAVSITSKANIGGAYNYPYNTVKLGGSWTKQSAVQPIVALKYDDGSYAYTGALPASAINVIGWASGSTPDERGLIFQMPFKCRVCGAFCRAILSGAGGTMDLVLYDSDGSTPLITYSIDRDIQEAITSYRWRTFKFATTAILTVNTNYRLVLKPTSAVANSVGLADFEVNAAAILNAVPGGQSWHYTERTDAGAWTQTTTKQPMMGLLIDRLDDGVGGGSIVNIIKRPRRVM